MTEPSPIEVPYTSLPDDTLNRLIEEFVTRDTTDYGAVEKTLAQKIGDVRRQLVRGEAKIVYDPDTESVNIVPAKIR